MIAKGKAIAHGINAINYIMRDGKLDKIVGRNMIEGDNPTDIIRDFEMINQYNQRCKNKYMRYEIGISPDDINKIEKGGMEKIAEIFTKKMGLENHQWIACTHKDTGKPHIHILANRIGVDRKVFDTTFMSNRSSRIAEEISKEMNFTIANSIKKKRKHMEEYIDPIRREVKEEIQTIAYKSLDESRSLDGFIYRLIKKDIDVELARNNSGKIFGVRFKYKDQVFKASDIGSQFGLNTITKNFQEETEDLVNDYTECFDNDIEKAKQIAQELKSIGKEKGVIRKVKKIGYGNRYECGKLFKKRRLY